MKRDDEGKLMWKEWKDIKRRKWIVNRYRGASGDWDLLETFLLEIDPFRMEEDEENEEEGSEEEEQEQEETKKVGKSISIYKSY